MINYDELAADYARHRQIHPEVLRCLAATPGLGPGASILEVGCGSGNYSLALTGLTGWAGWGIDPSGQMLAQAQVRPGTVTFQAGEAEELDFAGDFFDLVFSVDVIHHVADRPRYFQEAYRVLKAGGTLCTVTDSEEIIRRRQPLTVYFPETVEIELARYPAMADLRAAMVQAGFTRLAEQTVEFPYRLADSQPYRNKTYSSLHLISPEALARGLARMERDLERGPIPCVSRYVLLWGTK